MSILQWLNPIKRRVSRLLFEKVDLIRKNSLVIVGVDWARKNHNSIIAAIVGTFFVLFFKFEWLLAWFIGALPMYFLTTIGWSIFDAVLVWIMGLVSVLLFTNAIFSSPQTPAVTVTGIILLMFCAAGADMWRNVKERTKIYLYCAAIIGAVLAIQAAWPLLTPKVSVDAPQPTIYQLNYPDGVSSNNIAYLFGNISLKIKPALLPFGNYVSIPIIPSDADGTLINAWLASAQPYAVQQVNNSNTSVSLKILGDGWTYEQISVVIGYVEQLNTSLVGANRLILNIYPENVSSFQEQNKTYLVTPITLTNSAPFMICQTDQGIGDIRYLERVVQQLPQNDSYVVYLGDRSVMPSSLSLAKVFAGENANFFYPKDLLTPIAIKLPYLCVQPNSTLTQWLYFLPEGFRDTPVAEKSSYVSYPYASYVEDVRVRFIPETFVTTCKVFDTCLVSFQVENLNYNNRIYIAASDVLFGKTPLANEDVIVGWYGNRPSMDVAPNQTSDNFLVSFIYNSSITDLDKMNGTTKQVRVPIQLYRSNGSWIGTLNQYYVGTVTFHK